MQITTIAFGSVGSSWFVVLNETRSGRIQGLRWTPGYKDRGSWNLITVDLDEVRTERKPVCAKPPVPTQELVNQFIAKDLERKLKNRTKTKQVKQIQVRLDAGEQVTMTYSTKTWDRETHKMIPVTEPVEVVGTQGMRVLCKGHTEKGYYYGHRRIGIEYLS